MSAEQTALSLSTAANIAPSRHHKRAHEGVQSFPSSGPLAARHNAHRKQWRRPTPNCGRATALAPIISILTTIFRLEPPAFVSCSTNMASTAFWRRITPAQGDVRTTFAVALCQPKRRIMSERLRTQFHSAETPRRLIWLPPVTVLLQSLSRSPSRKGHEDKLQTPGLNQTSEPEGSARRSLVPPQPDVAVFAINRLVARGSNASSPAPLSRSSDLFAVRRLSGASQ